VGNEAEWGTYPADLRHEKICRSTGEKGKKPGEFSQLVKILDIGTPSFILGILNDLGAVIKMPNDPNEYSPVFRIDVSADSTSTPNPNGQNGDAATVALLRQLVVGQNKSNQLLQELVQQQNVAQRQRATELGQWKDANPDLARCCRSAAETLSRVQTEFLKSLTDEVIDNEDALMDGDFMFNEFVDRFGPRLAHLNGVLQVLSQLSTMPTPTNQS
jgi:hypothetical protein